MSVETVAKHFSATKRGDYWMAKCPLHNDETASLKICAGDTQEVIAKCFAGCDQSEIARLVLEITGKDSASIPEKKKRPRELTYVWRYQENAGETVYEKIRYEYKDEKGGKEDHFRHKGPDGKWIYSRPKGVHILFGTPKLKRLPDVPVIICEGEKCAILVNEVAGDKYVGVTSDNGQGWQKSFNKLLAGRTIYIAEDCDEPGRARSYRLSKEFPVKGVIQFVDKPKGYDIYDRLMEIPEGERLAELELLIQNSNREPEKLPRYVDTDTVAMREDYVSLYNNILPSLDRDIFSGGLMYLSQGLWLPAENQIETLESEAIEVAKTTGPAYKCFEVRKHLKWLEGQKDKRLLVDFPDWDGEDRIKFLCEQVKLRDVGVSQNAFYEISKSWLLNVFRKLRDPSMNSSPTREFILCLAGNEHIGKDYWIRAIFDGLGQWFSEFTITSNERDVYMQLHESLVLYFGEFDRSNKMESGLIKNLVTKPNTKLRASHDRRSEHRESRASFIASSNPTDILRDAGQNTRYAIFELESISRNYTKTKEFSLQVLAQALKLSPTDYVPSSESELEMRCYIREKTPQSIAEEIHEYYDVKCETFLNGLEREDYAEFKETLKRGYFTTEQAIIILEVIAKMTRMSLRQVQNKMNSLPIKKRIGTAKYFLVPEASLASRQFVLGYPAPRPDEAPPLNKEWRGSDLF